MIELDPLPHIPQSETELHSLIDRTIFGPRPAHQLDHPPRVDVYSRLSKFVPTTQQYSLEIQPEEAQEFARRQGWEIVGFHSDANKTGRHSRRDGLQQVIQDIKASAIDILLIHRLDRLYRNVASQIHFIDLLDRHHVRLVSVTERLDTDTAWGRLAVYVLSTVAETYVRSLSERTQEAKLARFKKGLPNGAIPFGYCNGRCSRCTDPNGPGYCPRVGQPDRGNGRVLVPHPIEMHARRLMEQLYRLGWSDASIADYLNSHDFSLPDTEG